MNNWISTKDRLPETAGTYLTTSIITVFDEEKTVVKTTDYGFNLSEGEKEYRGDLIYPNGAAFGDDWDGELCNIEKVLAWMPLPDPYKAESKDKTE